MTQTEVASSMGHKHHMHFPVHGRDEKDTCIVLLSIAIVLLIILAVLAVLAGSALLAAALASFFVGYGAGRAKTHARHR